MAVEVWWYLPGRILYSPGSLLREDIAARNAIALEMIETEGLPPMVHTLIDHTNRYTAEDLARAAAPGQLLRQREFRMRCGKAHQPSHARLGVE
jgi:hypothetical protein